MKYQKKKKIIQINIELIVDKFKKYDLLSCESRGMEIKVMSENDFSDLPVIQSPSEIYTDI